MSRSQEAWTVFYNMHYPFIRGIVRRRVPSSKESLREDFVQEVYAALMRALPQYNGNSSSLKTFVSMIAETTCTDCLRGLSRKSRSGTNEPVDHHDNMDNGDVILSSDLDLPEESLEKAQYRHLVKKSLRSLSEACQELLTLRFYSDLSHKEIAERLGKKENSVNQQVIRCLAYLRNAFTQIELREQGV